MISPSLVLLSISLIAQGTADYVTGNQFPTSYPPTPGEFGAFDPHPHPIMDRYPPKRIVKKEGDEVSFECHAVDVADHTKDTDIHELRLTMESENYVGADMTKGDIGFYGYQIKTLKANPNEEGRVDITETFELLITKSKISKDDEGWYNCRACVDGENRWGNYVEICDEAGARFYLEVQSSTTDDDDFGPSKRMAPRSTCQVFGDPHVVTYDGSFYNAATSPCSYVLAMDAENYSWFVYGKVGKCGVTVDGTCLEAVTLHVGSEALGLERGWLINYGGDKNEVLGKGGLTRGPFKIAFNGANVAVTVVLSDDGETEEQLVVLWDGYVSAIVQSPMNTPTMGLCGNNDGIDSNDFETWGVANDDNQIFSDSMRVDRYGQCSSGARPPTIRLACRSQDARKTARSLCLDLLYSGEFQPCFDTHEVANFLDACIFDQCKGLNITNNLYASLYIPDIDQKVQPACVVASAYATRCSHDFWNSQGEIAESQPTLALWSDQKGLCPDWEDKQKIYPKLGCPQSAKQYLQELN